MLVLHSNTFGDLALLRNWDLNQHQWKHQDFIPKPCWPGFPVSFPFVGFFYPLSCLLYLKRIKWHKASLILLSTKAKFSWTGLSHNQGFWRWELLSKKSIFITLFLPGPLSIARCGLWKVLICTGNGCFFMNSVESIHKSMRPMPSTLGHLASSRQGCAGSAVSWWNDVLGKECTPSAIVFRQDHFSWASSLLAMFWSEMW